MRLPAQVVLAQTLETSDVSHNLAGNGEHTLLGAVTFRTMPDSPLEVWKSQLLAGAGSDEARAATERYSEQLRQKHSGHAAATMSITAERRRALEIAYERAEQSVAVLRLYQDATYRPEGISVAVLYGQHNVPSRVGFLAKERRLAFAEQGHTIERAQEHHWIISIRTSRTFAASACESFTRSCGSPNVRSTAVTVAPKLLRHVLEGLRSLRGLLDVADALVRELPEDDVGRRGPPSQDDAGSGADEQLAEHYRTTAVPASDCLYERSDTMGRTKQGREPKRCRLVVLRKKSAATGSSRYW